MGAKGYSWSRYCKGNKGEKKIRGAEQPVCRAVWVIHGP